MNLVFDQTLAAGYSSKSQIARVLSEAWAVDNLYCVACTSDRLTCAPANTPVYDFVCPSCTRRFQIKAGRKSIAGKIVDGEYKRQIEAIKANDAPDLVLVSYSDSFRVENARIIPSHFIHEGMIECRKPLAPTARRAGWVGCNINLLKCPPIGILDIVSGGEILNKDIVRSKYSAAVPVQAIPISARGWLLDVLKAVYDLGTPEFTLEDVYKAESHLQTMHSENNNVRPKIRQQLQVLRDKGFVEFRGQGKYRLILP